MLRFNKIIFHLTIIFGFCLVLAACQKDPEMPFVNQSLNVVENAPINALDATPLGLINQAEAAALYKTFLLSHPNALETQFVGFKIKDLKAYLNLLSTKYQQEEVYVNFGQYSEQTTNDPNKIGRTTIFFSGNTAFQNLHSTELFHSKSGYDCLEYLNHGQLYP